MKEILKQRQDKAMSVQYQVMIIYVATNKYLLDIPVEEITRFEAEFLEFMDTRQPEVPNAIATEKEITSETEDIFVKAIKEFKESFKKQKVW